MANEEYLGNYWSYNVGSKTVYVLRAGRERPPVTMITRSDSVSGNNETAGDGLEAEVESS